MTIIKFSRHLLINKLERLPPVLRVVFAGSCAERLLPAYIDFSNLVKQGDPEMLTRIVSRLWEDISGAPMMGGELQASIDICVALIPPDDDMSLPVDTAYAGDAATAAVYTLRCRQNSDSQEAMWAAQCACAAVDSFTNNQEKVVVRPASTASQVYAHPLMQAELARQRRDIDELLRAAGEDARQVAARFRDRAKAESKIFFGVPS